jgi:Domain of unknown function (DUF4375)
MARPRAVSRSEPDAHYALPWNAMVDLCAMEPLTACTPTQRKAALVFWYQAEVNNGGHFQYFTNSAGAYRLEAVQALRELGAQQAAEILALAILRVSGPEAPRPHNIAEYAEQEAESGLRDLDSQYYKHADSEVQHALLKYLKAHEGEFVSWVA